MKILILTGHFFPEIHPRAFRAKELACNFAIKGHSVSVCTLRTMSGFDYKKYEEENNISIQNLNLYNQTEISRELHKTTNSFVLHLWKIYRYLLDYFLAGSLFINANKIKKKLKLSNDLDLVISLSTPFMNHLAIALAQKYTNNSHTRFIADSGDPFYRSQQTKRAPYFFLLERYVYKKFDFITIPAQAAVSAYKGLINPSKIKIIPQGFNLENIKLAQVNKSSKAIFAYSGVFYSDIRNPKFLLDFLVDLDINFQFQIYLRHKDSTISNLLDTYKQRLKNRITISYSINREELLFKLSSVDFLINIDNTTTTQIPSKLIDYAITKRPIFTCNPKSFDSNRFVQFLHKNYTGELKIDISLYDINTVTAQFCELL